MRNLVLLVLLALPLAADVVVDGKVTQSSNCRMRGLGAVLTIYGCTVNIGNYPITVPTVTFTLTAATGTGTVKVYQTSTGVIVLEHPSAAGLTITQVNGSVLSVPTPQFPPLESRPIGEASNSGTNWIGVISYGDNPQWLPMIGTDGVLITEAAGIRTFKADSTVMKNTGVNVATGLYDFTNATVTGLTTGTLGVSIQTTPQAVTEVETTLATINLPALSANTCVEVTANSVRSSGATALTLRLYHGASAIHGTLSSTTSGTALVHRFIGCNNGATNAQVWVGTYVTGTTNLYANDNFKANAIDTSVPTTITLKGQLDAAGTANVKWMVVVRRINL